MVTSSRDPEDVRGAYLRHANGFLEKPESVEGWASMLRVVDSFWFGPVRTPPPSR